MKVQEPAVLRRSGSIVAKLNSFLYKTNRYLFNNNKKNVALHSSFNSYIFPFHMYSCRKIDSTQDQTMALYGSGTHLVSVMKTTMMTRMTRKK